MVIERFNRRAVLKSAAIAAAATPALVVSLGASAQSSSWAAMKRKVPVRGLEMAYYEVGSGDPIVFLHGNPTSSYLWRNVIPHVQHVGRCIAPDMIGMGDSDRLPNSGPGVYKFATHRDYLFGLFEALELTGNAIFVVHDWGSGVGFSWAERFPQRVQGIAFMEPILRPPGFPPTPAPTLNVSHILGAGHGGWSRVDCARNEGRRAANR